ncbi:MAG: hypothetical protein COA88_09510 [Kordia sp.]|nr:MAG: hypothetical protein COA88_09510 [Kordia sp.]
MRFFFISIVAVTTLALVSCQDKRNKTSPINKTEVSSVSIDIPFVVAKNYFVNNSIKQLDNPKIETEKKFNKIFGMATTMGKNGKPTKIDFSKQYVIAVLKPDTDSSTTIEPESLQKNAKGEIVFTYKYKTGEKQTYTTLPNIAIIVDKSENGGILINEVK